MSLLKSLFGEMDETVNLKYDMSSWRSLEYSDMCVVVAKALIEYRHINRMTQADLAKSLGCSKRFIIKMETCALDDISFKLLIDLWTRLSTPEYNFGDIVMKELHKVVLKNYKQLCDRRWE